LKKRNQAFHNNPKTSNLSKTKTNQKTTSTTGFN